MERSIGMKRGLAAFSLCVLLFVAGCSPKTPASSAVSGGSPASETTAGTQEGGTTMQTSGAASGTAAGSAASSRTEKPTDPGQPTTAAVTTATSEPGGQYTSGSLNIQRRAIKAADAGLDARLLQNPDRGLRLETRLIVDGATPNTQYTAIDDLRDQREFYLEDSPQLAQAYFYLTGYADTPTLPSAAIARMQEFFDQARKWNIKLLLRFAYQYDQDNGGAVRPGGMGEAKQSVMFSHLDQLKPLLEKNKDILHVVQIGMIGAWGEWHSYSDSGEYAIDEAALVRKVMSILPQGVFAQIRLPEYKNLIPSSDPLYKRISFHDDAVFGVYHPWNRELSPGKEQYKQITREAASAPVDGEMFWGGQINQGGTPLNAFENGEKNELKRWNIIGLMAEQRMTSFSLRHSYRETDLGTGNGPFAYSMEKWKQRNVSKAELDAMGLFYAPGWFEKDGRSIARNAFEYMRDHLGYKLELQTFSASGALKAGGNLEVGVSLTNYGFSAAFNIESGFAVINSEGKVLTSVKAGDPASWHSRTPGAAADRDSNGFIGFSDKTRLTHEVSAKLPLPKEPGSYHLAFYARSTNGRFVNFGNNMTVINGYHVLESVTVA